MLISVKGICLTFIRLFNDTTQHRQFCMLMPAAHQKTKLFAALMKAFRSLLPGSNVNTHLRYVVISTSEFPPANNIT